MANQTFVVTHAKAREPLTIKGKTLEEALEKEGLNPSIWKEVPAPESIPEAPFGEDN